MAPHVAQDYYCCMVRDHDHGDHSELSEIERRVRALETVLTQKGYVDPAALDVLIDTYQTKIGPRNGARVVARAWVDAAYRDRLRRDATGAIAELGYTGRQGEHMIAVENAPGRHNLVVCTLCSCYPWPVLGLPPVWYKSAPYRSRGAFTWVEWANTLSREIGSARPLDESNHGEAYYHHWLKALETLVAAKGVASNEELGRLQEAWCHATQRTPHGAPIVLADEDL